MIGKLIILTQIKSHMSFVINLMSKFSSQLKSPKCCQTSIQRHWIMVDLRMYYNWREANELTRFSHYVNQIRDAYNQKSTSSYVFLLGFWVQLLREVGSNLVLHFSL
jgi:hypothetical protein